MTVLMQLVLLQDWQRVLIRARLFGNEVSKTCIVKLFEGKKFRVLPLHVACALDPPPQVVEALLVQGVTTSSLNKKKHTKKQRVLLDDEEQAIEASAIPPLSLAAVPVLCVRSKKKASKKKQVEEHKPTKLHRTSWKKVLVQTIRPPRDDQEELLQQNGSSSVVDIYHDDDDDSLLESRLASNGSVSGAATDLYAYSIEAATLRESSCYISPENSIGDTDGEDTDSICSTADGSDSFYTSTEDVDDEVVEVVAQDSSVLGSFLEQQGVVLQLTTSGNIQPLELPVQQLKRKLEPEEWSTIEAKPSGASSSISHSLSQQSSIYSDAVTGHRASIGLDVESFIQGIVDDGSQIQLLAIHIACLYGASAATMQVLLDAYPEGSLTGMNGMLPIHLVAANWKLPPIPLLSNAMASSTPSGMPSSLLYSELDLEDENAGLIKQNRLKVLIDATPETVLAKSVCHNLRPLEYLQYLVDSKTSNGQLKNEEACLFFLEDTENEYKQRNNNAESRG